MNKDEFKITPEEAMALTYLRKQMSKGLQPKYQKVKTLDKKPLIKENKGNVTAVLMFALIGVISIMFMLTLFFSGIGG